MKAQAVGEFLWLASRGERLAVGILNHMLATWPLADDERRAAREIRDQEIHHADLLRASARRYLAVQPDLPRPLNPVRLPRPLPLVTLVWAERLAQLGFARAMRLFGDLGDHETVASYRVIAVEERGHIAWGRDVLHRWATDDADMRAGIRAFLRSHVVSNAHRASWEIRGVVRTA